MYLQASHYPSLTLTSRTSGTSLLVVGGLHLLLLAVLASTRVVAAPPSSQGTLTVSVIQPETTKAQPVTPARPKPVLNPPAAKPVATPQPTLVAKAEAHSDVPATPAVKETPPPVAESKEPAPPAAAPAVAAAAPLVEPRFDADYLQNPQPYYPMASRRLQEEGKVLLRVFVEANGRPNSVEIKTSSGYARLDSAASEAVRQWKFVPARRGVEAVGAWVLVPITFSLRG
jgi:periplasmic protein TonB